MGAVDLLLVVMAIIAAAAGRRLTSLARASGWLGIVLGVVLATHMVTLALGRFGIGDPRQPLYLRVLGLATGALLGRKVGHAIGAWPAAEAASRHAEGAYRRAAWSERALRPLAAVVTVGCVAWLVGPAVSARGAWPASLSHNSIVLAALDWLAPDAPLVASPQSGTKAWTAWAVDFAAQLPAGPIPLLARPSDGLDHRVRSATVVVRHEACGGGSKSATGFVAAPDLVVTNAHVVAGSRLANAAIVVILNSTERHRGRVVAFDADNDLAVIRVEDLAVDPLPLAERSEHDQTGWIYGHPSNGPLQVRSFRAGTEVAAPVPDIYSTETLTRLVVPLRADLDHGYSGSALVSTDGLVIGVTFAISSAEHSLALAVPMPAVHSVLRQAIATGVNGPATNTGHCPATENR